MKQLNPFHPARTASGRARLLLALVATVVLTAGCATTRNTLFNEADEAVQNAEFSQALTVIEDNQNRLYSNRDGVLYFLDTGMLSHYAGEYEESTQRLNEAERLIEEYFTESVTQAVSTFLLNDTMRNYSGEDFEDIYLNVFKALNFIAKGQTDSALVEARRINIKLNLLEDKYRSLAESASRAEEAEGPDMEPAENRFYNSALARYLSLVLNRADGNMDGVRIDWDYLQEAFREQTNIYDFPKPLDETVAERSDGARLSVLAFSGRSPVKMADTLWVNTGSGHVTIAYASESEGVGRVPQGMASFPFPGVESGYRFRFEMPRMETRGSDVTEIRVLANGQPLGSLGKLEDIEQVALDTFEVRLPIIYLKTATRAIVKGVVGQRAGRAMREAGSETGTTIGFVAGLVGSVATSVALDATEEADLRISRFFPAYAHVGEWDLPPGEHELEVEYRAGNRVLHVDRIGMVSISSDGPNLISSFLIR